LIIKYESKNKMSEIKNENTSSLESFFIEQKKYSKELENAEKRFEEYRNPETRNQMLISDIDFVPYQNFRKTDSLTQHQFVNDFLNELNYEDSMIYLEVIVERLQKLEILHTEVRDEIYCMYQDTDLNDLDF